MSSTVETSTFITQVTVASEFLLYKSPTRTQIEEGVQLLQAEAEKISADIKIVHQNNCEELCEDLRDSD